MANVIRNCTNSAKTIRSVRIAPNRFDELFDTDFGTLDETKDGMLVSYDSETDKFILITADNVLEESAADGDIPDEFVEQLEDEIDLGEITITNLDGGTW